MIPICLLCDYRWWRFRGMALFVRHQYEHLEIPWLAHFDPFVQAKEVLTLAELMETCLCLSHPRPPIIGRPGHICVLTSLVAGCRPVHCPPRPYWSAR
jgi:hypothetical protein